MKKTKTVDAATVRINLYLEITAREERIQKEVAKRLGKRASK